VGFVFLAFWAPPSFCSHARSAHRYVQSPTYGSRFWTQYLLAFGAMTHDCGMHLLPALANA
jgi:hypothetical protein